MSRTGSRRWKCHYTRERVYEENGTAELVLSRLPKTRRALVVDAGCSTGAALKRLKELAGEKGTTIFAVGIEADPKTAKLAEKNLDLVLAKDFAEVSPSEIQADCIICNNVLVAMDGELVAEMLSHLGTLLSPPGFMVTNVTENRWVWDDRVRVLEGRKAIEEFSGLIREHRNSTKLKHLHKLTFGFRRLLVRLLFH